MNSLTASTFISSVNAPAKVTKQVSLIKQTDMSAEINRLKDICVNHSIHSYNGSYDSSYDSSYDTDYSGYNSHKSSYDSSDNSNQTVVSDNNHKSCYNNGCDGNKSHMLCPL